MKEKKIYKQKIKLTILFSILVFLLAIFLETIFFSFKYYHEKNNDKKIFLTHSNIIYKKIDKQKDIADIFLDDFLSDDLVKFDEKKIKELDNHIGNKISFFILDDNNNIVNKKIFEKVDFKIFSNLKNKNFYTTDSTFVLSKKLHNHILGDKIIFYSRYKYPISKLFEDLFLFIFVTFLSTIIFYIIGKKFVNKILKPVEDNLLEMEQFIQNSSHEFKTPISIIHSNLQLIKNISKEKEVIELSKDGILELENFNNLIDGVSELSGISLNIEKEKINLKKEIPEIVSEYLKLIKNKKIKIKYNFKENIKIIASKQHFKILFSNLFSNAIKYNKIGGEIKITLNKNKLIIADTGIGINKKNLGKIFDRFYRENNSKTGDGFGIGLSLVNKIISINNWKIKVKSDKQKGTIFEVKFK